MKVWIVVPAYNEEKSIGSVIDSLKEEGYRNMLVVDDGSTDRTAEVARDRGAQVLTHPGNLGLGAALRTGFREVLRRGADAAVTFDADGQHEPKSVRPLLEGLRDADLVIGVRRSSGMPLNKRVGNFILNLITLLLTGIYTDSQSGSRALSRKALESLRIVGNRYEVSSEILLRASRAGLKVKSVPVECYYPPHAKAKGTTILSGIRIFLKLLSFKLVR